MSVPPYARTCGQEPVGCVCLDWEAISGSQPPQGRMLLGATWRHQGGAERARVRHLVGEESHQFLLPWHWAQSTTMLTQGEQPVWNGRGGAR